MIVIGIGNEFRHDDRVGLDVIRRLQEHRVLPDLVEHNGEGAGLITLWQPHQAAIIVDAVRPRGTPGQIYRLNAHTEAIPRRFFHYSSHEFSLAEAVEMARTLGQLPAYLVIYGIEGERFDMGSGLSNLVEKAVEIVADQITKEIKLMHNSE